MSTISQTPKVNTAQGLKVRNLNLLIAAAIVLAVAAIFASKTAPAAQPVDDSAYMLYRQGEWLSVPITVNNAEAYQIFRSGEVASPLSNVEAYKIFRQGEVASVPNLNKYEDRYDAMNDGFLSNDHSYKATKYEDRYDRMNDLSGSER